LVNHFVGDFEGEPSEVALDDCVVEYEAYVGVIVVVGDGEFGDDTEEFHDFGVVGGVVDFVVAFFAPGSNGVEVDAVFACSCSSGGFAAPSTCFIVSLAGAGLM
jgi:hypothetical protein